MGWQEDGDISSFLETADDDGPIWLSSCRKVQRLADQLASNSGQIWVICLQAHFTSTDNIIPFLGIGLGMQYLMQRVCGCLIIKWQLLVIINLFSLEARKHYMCNGHSMEVQTIAYVWLWDWSPPSVDHWVSCLTKLSLCDEGHSELDSHTAFKGGGGETADQSVTTLSSNPQADMPQ